MIDINKILCPIDFGESSCEALSIAGNIARQFKAELCVMHVIEPVDVPNRVLNDTEDAGFEMSPPGDSRAHGAERELCDLLKRLKLSDVLARPIVRYGSPAEEILDVSREEEADLIVIAAHGSTGWRRYLFGTVTDEILYPAPCSVLVVKPTVSVEGDEEPSKEGVKAEMVFSNML